MRKVRIPKEFFDHVSPVTNSRLCEKVGSCIFGEDARKFHVKLHISLSGVLGIIKFDKQNLCIGVSSAVTIKANEILPAYQNCYAEKIEKIIRVTMGFWGYTLIYNDNFRSIYYDYVGIKLWRAIEERFLSESRDSLIRTNMLDRMYLDNSIYAFVKNSNLTDEAIYNIVSKLKKKGM